MLNLMTSLLTSQGPDPLSVLKYQLIPTRTAGEEAFWKSGQTDRTTEKQIVTSTDNIRVAIAERSRTNTHTRHRQNLWNLQHGIHWPAEAPFMAVLACSYIRGAPVGPRFSWTCWTFLNPPLTFTLFVGPKKGHPACRSPSSTIHGSLFFVYPV